MYITILRNGMIKILRFLGDSEVSKTMKTLPVEGVSTAYLMITDALSGIANMMCSAVPP